MADRIRLRRTAGWRKPVGAVVVARPSRWGNPFRIGHEASDRADAVDQFASILAARRRQPRPPIDDGYPSDDEIRHALAGKDLGCWCPLDGPCHADVLLRHANARAG